jgi:probable O-glycosylation ligase (exosortase A-associated)
MIRDTRLRSSQSLREPTAIAGKPSASAKTPSTAKAMDPLMKGTLVFFIGYLTLILVEYIGLANEIGALKAMRFSTLLSYTLALIALARYGFGTVAEHRQVKIIFALIAMTVLGMLHAVVRTYAYNSIQPFLDSFMFLTLSFLLVDRRTRIDMLAVVFVVVALVLYLRNGDKLGSAMRVGGFRAPYFMGDGNDFAWGLNVLLPIIAVLLLGKRNIVMRGIGLVGCAVCLLAIVETQSRGATLGLGAALLYYWLGVAKRKTLGAVGVALVVIVVMLVAPSQYFSRMESISDYEEDNSAQARLQAWGAAIRMATDRPWGVGAGNFSTAYGRIYRPSEDDSRMVWGNARWISAHSVYFKVLGEYGFGGVALLIWLIFANLRDNIRSRRLLLAAGDRAPVSDYWPVLLNMSIVAYAINGIFLGGFMYPHIFLLTGLTLGAKRLAARAPAELVVAPAAVGTQARVGPPARAGLRTALRGPAVRSRLSGGRV